MHTEQRDPQALETTSGQKSTENQSEFNWEINGTIRKIYRNMMGSCGILWDFVGSLIRITLGNQWENHLGKYLCIFTWEINGLISL